MFNIYEAKKNKTCVCWDKDYEGRGFGEPPFIITHISEHDDELMIGYCCIDNETCSQCNGKYDHYINVKKDASVFVEFKFISIEDWVVISPCNEYTAPELIYTVLTGKVYGHPDFNDGDGITTSKITSINLKKKIAKTYSGNWYRLLTPNKDWVQWLRKTFGSKYMGDIYTN